MIRWLGAAASVFAMTVNATADSLPIEPYRTAASRGEVGSIEGRAHAERRKPDVLDAPLTGLVVVLMPLSEPLITEVERVKSGARDSMEAYRASAPRIKRLEEAYELALWDGGAVDLVRSTVIGPDGGFAFADVPAGRWLVFGRLEMPSPVVPRKAKPGNVAPFDQGRQVVGHRSAAFWLVPVSVSPGEAAEVTLTDRNIWHTGVIEELQDSAGRSLVGPKAKGKKQ